MVRVIDILSLQLAVCEVVGSTRHKCFIGSVVQVLCLFAYAILTGVSKTALNTSLTRSFIAYITVIGQLLVVHDRSDREW